MPQMGHEGLGLPGARRGARDRGDCPPQLRKRNPSGVWRSRGANVAYRKSIVGPGAWQVSCNRWGQEKPVMEHPKRAITRDIRIRNPKRPARESP